MDSGNIQPLEALIQKKLVILESWAVMTIRTTVHASNRYVDIARSILEFKEQETSIIK